MAHAPLLHTACDLFESQLLVQLNESNIPLHALPHAPAFDDAANAAKLIHLWLSHAVQIIATVGWDRQLRILDEVAGERDDPLLRRVDGAHQCDITSLALSHTLGLIATGGSDGSLKVTVD